MNITNINEKFSDGKPLTDEELDFFVEYMEDLGTVLSPLGREYCMVSTYVAMQLNVAKEFQRHRKNS